MQVSIWERETFFAPQDVLIIGSGFVGLWAAFYLKRRNPKLRITIVERGLIPTGASTRNAGFACFGSLSEVIHDARSMGTDKTLALIEMRYKGLERIRKHFKPSQIDFALCGGYELYDDRHSLTGEELDENIRYINSLLRPITGITTYQRTDEAIPAFGFGATRHLVRNGMEGCLHSGKLLQALLHRVQGMGVQVLTGVEATGYQQGGEYIQVQNRQGLELRGRQLLLCTNAFTKQLAPHLDIVPARGQVLLTSSIEGLPWQGTFHSDEGYYYFRHLGRRVLLGGARNKAFEAETTTDLQTSDTVQNFLEQYLDEVVLPGFKGQYTIENRWAGIMAMGSEKMPIVEHLEPNVFCAVRMSGMGVALAPVAGSTVAKLMTKA
jgi:gamma-glutamylputrescine oxidase